MMNLKIPAFLVLPLCVLTSSCEQSSVTATDVAKQAAPEVSESASSFKLPEEVSFNEHIQPILSEYCYHCHGPDSGTREPKSEPLRLDIEAEAFAVREESEPIIVKGKPKESLMIKRLHETDPDSIMPPPNSHKTLDPEKIALLEKWVEQGAPYEAHWSFVPVKRPEPTGTHKDWVKSPIDSFVAEKLETAGLSPNPPENPRRFYRRMHLDLTGVPPKPENVDAFETAFAADPEATVARAADEMLATPASAEHFARHWLDAARYADTHGIHIDNYRAIWPFRDWVVQAFRNNMPWDQFTIEQIAGDILPSRTLDQHVATGFNRCLATTGEGGAIGEEYDAIYAKDRVETTSAIWLGLTTGCAACHDHKFDPISTKEFYSLTAYFRNTPITALDGNNAEHPPTVFVPLPEDRSRWAELKTEITKAEQQAASRKTAANPDFQQWLTTASIEATREIDSTLAIHLPLSESEGPIRGTVDGQVREWSSPSKRIEAVIGQAPVISENVVDLGDYGAFARADQVTYGGFVRVEGKPTGAIVARMDPQNGHRGWDIYLVDGRPGAHVIDSWDKAANKVVAPKALENGKWHHLMVTFDGTKPGHQALSIYVDGVKQGAASDPNSVGGNIVANVPLRLGARHNDDSRLNGPVALQDFRFYRRLLPAQEIAAISASGELRKILALPVASRQKEQTDKLFTYFLANVDEPFRGIQKQLDALKSEQSGLKARGSASLVMEEKKDEPFAHVLTRGVYSDKGEKVGPGTLAILPPMPASAPKNRLGFATWLMDPANPLTARVTMNRTWYYFFGTGIVETTEDFGIMGARPSHPRLLDWLAAEFVDSKWNYRQMLKTIVCSATYRQSGTVSAEKLEKDPFNRLLSRGPRYRLDAEQIRDLALATSGLLSSKMGGPSVRPYQPEGIWEAVAMPQSNTRTYIADRGESLYRRSIYTFWKRTAPHPTMEILNAPSREIFCVRRDRTNTPLQAFVTLNDPQFVEASRRLAERLIENSKDFDARLDLATSLYLSRAFAADERAIVRETLDEALKTFKADPASAKSFIATGETKPAANLDPAEVAAWTLIASQLFNLDETLNK
jgi:hypothetical protein